MLFLFEAGNSDELAVETKTCRRHCAYDGCFASVQLPQTLVGRTVIEIYFLCVDVFIAIAERIEKSGGRRNVEVLHRKKRGFPEAPVRTKERLATVSQRCVVVATHERSRDGVPHLRRQIFQKHMTRNQEASVGAETYGTASLKLFAGNSSHRFDGFNDLFGRRDIPLLKYGHRFRIDGLDEGGLLGSRRLVRRSRLQSA